MYKIKPTEKSEYTDLGPFIIKSGKIRASDPCYSDNDGGGYTFEAKKGNWYGDIREVDTEGPFGVRVTELTIWHESETYFDFDKVTEDPVDVAVDAGCFGFFDNDNYPPEDWADLLNEESVVVTETGILSDSGFGDGSYPCFVYKNQDGKILGAKVIFLLEDETDE